MKILLTGATGYIGKRLLPALLEEDHEVVCTARDQSRFYSPWQTSRKLSVVQVDFLSPDTIENIPDDIEVAYYLIHSMSATTGNFEKMEQESATNFRNGIVSKKIKKVIYLSGIVNDQHLSRHLRSRKNVEVILADGPFQLITLRAGIIVGSGSASFEIIRDLVEKLPIMITPRWLHTNSQPIAIRNVIQFLKGVLSLNDTASQAFDIGGPEVLSYKQMLLKFAGVRQLKRLIFTIPIMTPRLSSYWLYFVTSTSYKLAVNLVNSMKVEVIGKPNKLHEHLKIEMIDFESAIRMAFDKIEQKEVLSSWTDAQSSNVLTPGISRLIEVPIFGCYRDKKKRTVINEQQTIHKIWSIGGQTGWYYGNWLWGFRGFLDKLIGGVGLRRGRKNPSEINAGETLDFWRVLYANKLEKRLLLYAEMKLPGEAWLEFKIEKQKLHQIATFRPLGIWGRLYWFLVLPFHYFIFNGLINKLTK